jgi:hypothetical protein
MTHPTIARLAADGERCAFAGGYAGVGVSATRPNAAAQAAPAT